MTTHKQYSSLDKIMTDVQEEYLRASNNFDDFNSTHEGYGVIKEEFDELWDEIKANGTIKDMRKEATQLAAMAIRFISDLCPEKSKQI